jgi:fatty-acyl-CoA synthase
VTALPSLAEQTHRQSTGDLVRRTALRSPDRPAIVFGGRTWTYAELVDDARRAAAGLVSLGVGKGDRVIVLGRNSADYAITWLATQLLGAIHVPVNYSLGSREVAYVLQHSEASVALADADLLETLSAAARESGSDARLALLDGDGDGGTDDVVDFHATWGDEPLPDVAIDSEDIAQIAYTSGTESAPKGAMLSHRALIAQYVSCIAAGEYHERDVLLHSLPLYHCAQMHCFLMPGLYLGCKNVIIPAAAPGPMIAAIAEQGVTSVFAPPTVWIGLLGDPGFEQSAVSTVEKAYYGASIMPVATVRELLKRLEGLRLFNYYGQTELSPLATCLGPDEQLTKPGSAGRPVINVETRVVDDDMRDVEDGEVGEVVHRSPQLTTGYYKDPVKTEEAFAGGWFHSGDLAIRDADGYITIVDRKKDMINTGGENVSSREVEETLYEHPDVAEVAVVGVADPKWIEAVCAVVVRRPGAAVSGDELIAFAKERLAGYKVPKRAEFVDALPKNPSGKILKRELRQVFADAPGGG